MPINELEEMASTMRDRKEELEEYLTYNSAIGHMNTALSRTLSGIAIHERTIRRPNRNKFKKIFFTRPMLNLNFFNLVSSRKLATLLTSNEKSIERYIHLLLDPRQEYGEGKFMAHGTEQANDVYNAPKRSILINQYEPFMPILSNTIDAASGFLDIALETYTSTPGMRKEVVGWTDSINKIYTSWPMETKFINDIDSPTYKLFDIWVEYQSAVATGRAMPWFDFLLGRRIDYTTGVFVLVLGEDGRSIQHTAKTIAHPITNPTGKVFTISDKHMYSDEDNDINMRWKCYGAEYDDPMTLLDFNRHVSSFNPKLRGFITQSEADKTINDYVEIPPSLYEMYSGIAIPYIDLRYKKLEYLVSKSDMVSIKKNLAEVR